MNDPYKLCKDWLDHHYAQIQLLPPPADPSHAAARQKWTDEAHKSLLALKERLQ